jgi:archaeal flagellin FlaB
MFNRLIKGFKESQKGITGLETAIILIAFVVVAAVFAYAILSAGMYSSQKSQQAVYSGLKEAQGATTINGAVVAMAEHTGDTGYVSQLTFTVSAAMSGQLNDFTPPLTSGTDGKAPGNSPNKVTISYIDPYQKVDDLFWTLNKLGYSNAGNILDPDEKFQITIGDTLSRADSGAGSGNLVDALAGHHLGPNTRFTLEIKAPSGPTLVIERVTPAVIDKVMNLK